MKTFKEKVFDVVKKIMEGKLGGYNKGAMKKQAILKKEGLVVK